jgi:hypothetical protein
MKLHSFVFSGLALGGAALLLAPAESSYAFVKNGSTLGLGQRDVRVFDNFADAQSNNNTVAQPNFPSKTGVEMASWKGAVEWGSKAHGNGEGDPTQAILGDGGANFDFAWMGNANAAGTVDDNIIMASSCPVGVISNTFLPSTNGWRIVLCDPGRIWEDDPGATVGATEFDIQSAVAHELGHALGLGHSADPTATMDATIVAGTVDKRSIEADDIAGIQCIYGVASATKPMITKVTAVNGPGGITVTVTGMNFDPLAKNDLWFTPRLPTSPGADPRVRVLNLASSGGGTKIVALMPANTPAGNGDILVKISGQTSDKVSNAAPIKLR